LSSDLCIDDLEPARPHARERVEEKTSFVVLFADIMQMKWREFKAAKVKESKQYNDVFCTRNQLNGVFLWFAAVQLQVEHTFCVIKDN
jgi:hypothetical protein